jgi:hypothetical protein
MRNDERAIARRINRVLKRNGQLLRKSRPGRFQFDVGGYYVVDTSGNFILAKFVDLQTLAADLGI